LQEAGQPCEEIEFSQVVKKPAKLNVFKGEEAKEV
jgi:hypothetical protein